MRENRRNIRIRLKGIVADLTFKKNGATENRNVKDMSLSGIFVEGVSGVEINEQCRVHLKGWKSPIDFLSKVARVDSKGVGLRFLDISYDTCELLRTLMLYKAEDPLETAQLFQESCT